MRLAQLALAASIILVPLTAKAQNCEELRLACERKQELGEVGEGNCRRFREQCGERRQVVNCADLRAACLHKEQLGEVGEGNCRRYRELCRGQRHWR
jgi:hypothetical protein